MTPPSAPFQIDASLDGATVRFHLRHRRTASKVDIGLLTAVVGAFAYLAWATRADPVVVALAVVLILVVTSATSRRAEPSELVIQRTRNGWLRDGRPVDIALNRTTLLVDGVACPFRRPLTQEEHLRLHELLRPRDTGSETDVPPSLTGVRQGSRNATSQHEPP